MKQGTKKGTMKQGRMLTLVAGVILLLPQDLAPAAPHARHRQRTDSVQITGAVEKPGAWTSARLGMELADSLKTVAYTLKREKGPEEKGEARCIPLLALAQAAKPRLNAKVKNHLLAFVVLVRADDGYTAAFSMGELLPQYGNRKVWVALDRNGKPLVGEEVPVQLLVPDDAKPSRWVHGVTTITVLDGFEAADKNSKK